MKSFTLTLLTLLILTAPSLRGENDFDDGEGDDGRPPLAISPTRPLLFPSTAAGEGPFTLAPSAGAQFLVTGKPHRKFRIFLPGSPITMSHSSGGSITVSGWTSTPSGIGRLGADGRQTIYVGATRAPLNAFLSSGKYHGNFSIAVRRFAQNPSTLGESIVQILASLSLTRLSDLSFRNRVQGDPAITVSPNSPGAANFELQGEPNKQYVMILPNRIVLKTGGGSTPQQQIAVTNFTANVLSSGCLPNSGRQTVSLGATLGAINPFQQSGNYTGTLLLSVTYQ